MEDANKMGHCGGCTLQVADAVGVLQLQVVDLFIEFVGLDVVEHFFVLEYHELVNSFIH